MSSSISAWNYFSFCKCNRKQWGCSSSSNFFFLLLFLCVSTNKVKFLSVKSTIYTVSGFYFYFCPSTWYENHCAQWKYFSCHTLIKLFYRTLSIYRGTHSTATSEYKNDKLKWDVCLWNIDTEWWAHVYGSSVRIIIKIYYKFWMYAAHLPLLKITRQRRPRFHNRIEMWNRKYCTHLNHYPQCHFFSSLKKKEKKKILLFSTREVAFTQI